MTLPVQILARRRRGTGEGIAEAPAPSRGCLKTFAIGIERPPWSLWGERIASSPVAQLNALRRAPHRQGAWCPSRPPSRAFRPLVRWGGAVRPA